MCLTPSTNSSGQTEMVASGDGADAGDAFRSDCIQSKWPLASTLNLFVLELLLRSPVEKPTNIGGLCRRMCEELLGL